MTNTSGGSQQIHQVSIKVMASVDSEIDSELLIGIFHRWIREKALADHLLIDVADYQHVPHGPGVFIVADEAHFGVDFQGAPGFIYSRKRDPLRAPKEALDEALGRALVASELLAAELSLGGRFNFEMQGLEMRIMSRLHTPNTESTHAVIAPLWEQVLSSRGIEGAVLTPLGGAREPFGMRLSGASVMPSCKEALAAQ